MNLTPTTIDEVLNTVKAGGIIIIAFFFTFGVVNTFTETGYVALLCQEMAQVAFSCGFSVYMFYAIFTGIRALWLSGRPAIALQIEAITLITVICTLASVALQLANTHRVIIVSNMPQRQAIACVDKGLHDVMLIKDPGNTFTKYISSLRFGLIWDSFMMSDSVEQACQNAITTMHPRQGQ
ncbi:hypothetical protein [Thalassospira mesophila]|uniref:Uncharacterized protein n=1 Tax=Thalassospira mesophila TaxID=1293891 RepID=A0A1Y2L214_9PROT|nr:hypothetical protein [Thalassospira mesophila]OSQ39004.1 hypothetical protein TMES_09930 [Thalassospira mesophila]